MMLFAAVLFLFAGAEAVAIPRGTVPTLPVPPRNAIHAGSRDALSTNLWFALNYS